MNIPLPAIVKEFGNRFFSNHFQCFLVGGAVRNMVAGLGPTDFDFATDALPQQVCALFSHVIPTGIKHGTVTVFFRKHRFEVTTFRIDGIYSNARHPDSIQFTPSIEEDLARRDFTINALACDIHTGEILDPHHGIADLSAGLIRAIGKPSERFSEDGLRLLRACRFTAQLGFSVEPATKKAMYECRNFINAVSAERIRDELEKILRSEKPSRAFLTMAEAGLLPMILPELSACASVAQAGDPPFDLLTHLLRSCDYAPKDNLNVRLAALLHDIGKPSVMEETVDGNVSFHGHEKISSRLAHRILARYRFPKAVEQQVCHLIEHHMTLYNETWSDGAVRRFIARVGRTSLDDLFLLLEADCAGKIDSRCGPGFLQPFRTRIEQIISNESALSLRDLAVDGRILTERCGIKSGPLMGVILKELLETVLDDPSQNTEETLVAIASRLYRNLSS